MKKTVFSALLFILFAVSLYAQESQISQVKKLNQQAIELDKAGKLDEAILTAEKIVEIEKKSRSLDPKGYAMVLDNLARLKQKRIKIDEKNKNSDTLSGKEKDIIEGKMKQDISDVTSLFYQALKVYEEEIKAETPHSVSIKREYAKTLFQYRFLGISDRVERLFTEVIDANTKFFGEKNITTLAAINDFAAYYFQILELEKSSELFEKYIQIVENSYGRDHQMLIPALRHYARILAATGQDDKAKQVAEQVFNLTNEKEDLDIKPINLSARSEDSGLSLKRPPEKGIMRPRNPSTADATSASKFTHYAVIEGLGAGNNRMILPIKRSDILVEVSIDENGKVTQTKALNQEVKLVKSTEKDVLKWKFRPFVYQGKAIGLKGYVIYLD